jgi:hypothetical protein
MLDALPTSVRYVKNGSGGRWWQAAKSLQQVHLGWSNVPGHMLLAADRTAIEPIIASGYNGKKGAAKNDCRALWSVLDRPSQHLWVTFQDGCMWWCTVRDGITINQHGESRELGHFWLQCDRPWSSQSIGLKHLAMANLPGTATKVAMYQATICKPSGWPSILRIIRDEEDKDAVAAARSRQAYEICVAKLIARLGPKDFELLIDLILSRTGWIRLAKLGGATEGIDIEAENVAANEIAFVQVKSAAAQSVVDDYIERFNARRERYDRMIFAVHTPIGALNSPPGQSIQIWSGSRIAELVVRLGFGEWVANRM